MSLINHARTRNQFVVAQGGPLLSRSRANAKHTHTASSRRRSRRVMTETARQMRTITFGLFPKRFNLIEKRKAGFKLL